MRKIELQEIRNIAEYEKVREAMRADIIALKKNRRLEVGPNLSLVFENRETVLFQIHEMVRTERLVDERKIQDEIDAYANLIPGPGELSATLFIEIPGIAEMPHEKAIEASGSWRTRVNPQPSDRLTLGSRVTLESRSRTRGTVEREAGQ